MDAVVEHAVILGLIHQVHDVGLDVNARHLRDELEDFFQGGEVARVDVLT